MPLANYMLSWLEKYKKGKIRPSSYERYQFCLQLLCKDELAHMDIRSIRLEDIQEYVNRLEDMSASTIKKQKLLLSQVLEHAMLTEVIQRNPVQGVQMPPMSHNTKVVYPYEKDDQEKLMAAFTEEKNGRLRLRYGWGCVLILETGLRAGEALALEWGDIDEEKRALKVNKNMVRVDDKNLVQRTTKTESGRQTIPYNSQAMEAVQHLKAQAIPGCPYVFATQTGEHLLPEPAGDDGEGLRSGGRGAPGPARAAALLRQQPVRAGRGGEDHLEAAGPRQRGDHGACAPTPSCCPCSATPAWRSPTTATYTFSRATLTTRSGWRSGRERVRATPRNTGTIKATPKGIHETAYLRLLYCRAGNRIRPASPACQPDTGSPARTGYSVWRPVFEDLGIVSFGT